MKNLTLIELLQCAYWSIGGLLPLFLSMMAGSAEKERDLKGATDGGGILLMLLACFCEAAILICAYKAGGK